MTVPPDPDTPCLRVRFGGSDGADGHWGNRLYFKYSSGPASAADLATFAGDVITQWTSHLAPLVVTAFSLTEVDVLDITSHTGLSNVTTTSVAGTRSGAAIANQVCFNMEFDIARRYRGGKPRIYAPFGTATDQFDGAKWQASFPGVCNTAFAAFIAALEAVALATITAVSHVNLSYYQGFTNVTNSSGRTRAAPKYRSPNAIHDTVIGYAGKVEYGSQRRRRVSVGI